MESVGVLWDYYWVTVRSEETLEEQLALLTPWLLHVHAKNLERDEDGNPRAAMVAADGELDWCLVINRLRAAGYEGYISDEYEKFWHPERYPDPEVGMREDARFLRECLVQEPPKPSQDPAPRPL